MEITTRHTPAYGVARLQLAGGESARVESGAMMAMSAGVELRAQAGLVDQFLVRYRLAQVARDPHTVADRDVRVREDLERHPGKRLVAVLVDQQRELVGEVGLLGLGGQPQLPARLVDGGQGHEIAALQGSQRRTAVGLAQEHLLAVDLHVDEGAAALGGQEHDEGDELVDGPEDVAGDVGDTLLNVIVKLSDNTVTSDGAVSDQTGLNRVILKLKSLSHSNIKRSSYL